MCSRPEPVIPAMPTISPAPTIRSTPLTVPPDRPRISSSGVVSSIASVAVPSSIWWPTISSIKLGVPSSLTGAVVTLRPSRSTVTRSASSNTSSRWCETYRIETPRSLRRWTTSNRRLTSSPGRVAVGSSRTSRLAPSSQPTRARAIATAVRCDGASVDTGALTSMWLMPRRSSASRARRVSSRQRMRRPRPVRYPAPNAMFSTALTRPTNPRSWWTKRMPASAAAWPSPSVSGVPSTQASPAPGSGW